MSKKNSTFAAVMDNNEEKKALQAMFRRWVYMVIAIVASAVLSLHPVFSFQEDKGIIYIRSFSMDQETFYVTQTELRTGAEQITATMSVKGLYFCRRLMLFGCILCLLCFFSKRWRLTLALITAFIAGAYYVLMIYYAMRMSDDHYATLYPNLMAVFPAIVLQMMILVRQNIIKSMITAEDTERGDVEEWLDK